MSAKPTHDPLSSEQASMYVAESDHCKIDQHLDFLKSVNFEQNLRGMYKLTWVEATKLDPRLANVVFDHEKNRAGWTISKIEWMRNHPESIETLIEDAEYVRSRFRYVIFCGMGGSGLCARVLNAAYNPSVPKLYPLMSCDPEAIKKVIDDIKESSGTTFSEAARSTVAFFTSRKGTTIETHYHHKYFEQLFRESLSDISDREDFRQHMWFFTEMPVKGHPNRGIQLNGVTDISGGRYYAPTARPFLFPLALISPSKPWAVLERAQRMNDYESIEDDPYLKLACFLYHMATHRLKDKVTIITSEPLSDLSLEIELILEHSICKQGKGVACFFGEELDIESLGNEESCDRVFLRLCLGKDRPKSELWNLLGENRHPRFQIVLEELDDLGGFILGFERTVVAIGYLWKICASNVPEFYYKQLTEKMITSARPLLPSNWECVQNSTLTLSYGPLIETGTFTLKQLNQVVNMLGGSIEQPSSVLAAILCLLKKAPNFKAVELAFYGYIDDEIRLLLNHVRKDVFNRTLRIPCKLSEGSLRNHTHHDAIEYGKNIWLTIFLAVNQPIQPDELSFESRLSEALAISTLTSLIQRGRRGLLISLHDKTLESLHSLKYFFKQVNELIAPFFTLGNSSS